MRGFMQRRAQSGTDVCLKTIGTFSTTSLRLLPEVGPLGEHRVTALAELLDGFCVACDRENKFCSANELVLLRCGMGLGSWIAE